MYIYIYMYIMGMSQIWVSPNWMICYMDQHLFLLGLKFWLIGVMATTLESNIWQERILHSKTFFPLKPHEHVVFKCFSYLFIFSSEFLLSKPQWLFRLSIAMTIFLRLGIAQILSGQGAQSLCHGVDLFGESWMIYRSKTVGFHIYVGPFWVFQLYISSTKFRILVYISYLDR